MKKRRRQPVDKVLDSLRERAKELDCLYRIEELLKDPEAPLDKIFRGIVAAVPAGWQFPNICVAKLVLNGEMYVSPGFKETEWMLKAVIRNQKKEIGAISVYYTEEMPSEHTGPFHKEEKRLIATIADRIGHFIAICGIPGPCFALGGVRVIGESSHNRSHRVNGP